MPSYCAAIWWDFKVAAQLLTTRRFNAATQCLTIYSKDPAQESSAKTRMSKSCTTDTEGRRSEQWASVLYPFFSITTQDKKGIQIPYMTMICEKQDMTELSTPPKGNFIYTACTQIQQCNSNFKDYGHLRSLHSFNSPWIRRTELNWKQGCKNLKVNSHITNCTHISPLQSVIKIDTFLCLFMPVFFFYSSSYCHCNAKITCRPL